MKIVLPTAMLTLVAGAAFAVPVTYQIDPGHTYPSFEADHFGGLSVWRGKFDSTSGTVVYDKEAKAGSIEVTVDMNTINFGMQKLNDHARSVEIFDVAKFPVAKYSGKFSKFNGDAPTEAQGTLTLHGVTKPVTLSINSFKCILNPMSKKQVCGADISATINRADFGVNYGEKFGFKQEVKLLIQVEGSPAA